MLMERNEVDLLYETVEKDGYCQVCKGRRKRYVLREQKVCFECLTLIEKFEVI